VFDDDAVYLVEAFHANHHGLAFDHIEPVNLRHRVADDPVFGSVSWGSTPQGVLPKG
jgi:hypothetical protein